MLQHTRHIIFATNFSDACHAAIPAVARWVDLLQCKLTLLHVYDADRILYRDANALLQSFFAEADNYPQCQRVLMSGDPAEGISEFCQRHRDALLVLPPSDQTGLPRPWHRSLRARMIQTLPIPVWTLGRTMVGSALAANSDRHLGVWLSSPEEGLAHVRQAAQYAAQTGSTLHLLHVVPDVNEGSLTHTLRTQAPLGEEYAEEWLTQVAASLDSAQRVEIHVGQGKARRVLPRLIRSSGAELLMVSQNSAIERGLFRSEVSSIFRECCSGIVSVPVTAHGKLTVSSSPAVLEEVA